MRTREIRRVQAELVGSDKQQCEDDSMAWRRSDWLIVLCGRESRLTASGDPVTIVQYIRNQEAEEKRLEQMRFDGL